MNQAQRRQIRSHNSSNRRHEVSWFQIIPEIFYRSVVFTLMTQLGFWFDFSQSQQEMNSSGGKRKRGAEGPIELQLLKKLPKITNEVYMHFSDDCSCGNAKKLIALATYGIDVTQILSFLKTNMLEVSWPILKMPQQR